METLIAEEAQIKRNIAKFTDKKVINNITGKTKKSGINPILKFLEQEEGPFLWSPDVYALKKKKFEGEQFEVLGLHEDLIVFRSNTRPAGANNIVYNQSNRKLGLFMGKIIVLHEKSSEFEDFVFKTTAEKPDYHNGVYFINSEDFSESRVTVEKIASAFKSAKVDLDISYARVRAN